ncbi:MAG: hypothetical protein PHT80_14310 [Lentisphaeria bacterium]|nr:hypothetical protein [Lentisphaeria bacterium]
MIEYKGKTPDSKPEKRQNCAFLIENGAKELLALRPEQEEQVVT